MKLLLQYGDLGYYVAHATPLTTNPLLAHEFDDKNESTWRSVMPDYDGIDGKYVASPMDISDHAVIP